MTFGWTTGKINATLNERRVCPPSISLNIASDLAKASIGQHPRLPRFPAYTAFQRLIWQFCRLLHVSHLQ